MSLQILRMLELIEGAPLPLGTRRSWQGGVYVKTSDGWKPEKKQGVLGRVFGKKRGDAQHADQQDAGEIERSKAKAYGTRMAKLVSY